MKSSYQRESFRSLPLSCSFSLRYHTLQKKQGAPVIKGQRGATLVIRIKESERELHRG